MLCMTGCMMPSRGMHTPAAPNSPRIPQLARPDVEPTPFSSIQDPDERRFEEFLAVLNPNRPLRYQISSWVCSPTQDGINSSQIRYVSDVVHRHFCSSQFSSMAQSNQLRGLSKSAFSIYGNGPKFPDLLSSEIHDNVVQTYFKDIQLKIEDGLGSSNNPIQIDQRPLSQMDLQDLLRYTGRHSFNGLCYHLQYVDSEIERFRTLLEKDQYDLIKIKVSILYNVTIYTAHGSHRSVQKKYSTFLDLDQQKSQEYLYKMNSYRTRLMQIASRLNELNYPITLNQPQILTTYQAFDPDKSAVNCPLISRPQLEW